MCECVRAMRAICCDVMLSLGDRRGAIRQCGLLISGSLRSCPPDQSHTDPLPCLDLPRWCAQIRMHVWVALNCALYLRAISLACALVQYTKILGRSSASANEAARRNEGVPKDAVRRSDGIPSITKG